MRTETSTSPDNSGNRRRALPSRAGARGAQIDQRGVRRAASAWRLAQPVSPHSPRRYHARRDATAPRLPHPPLRRLAIDSGLPPVRLHDLRHGAASLAHAAGADLKTVQEQLGHTSIVLTADSYTSVLLDLHFKTAEATARLVLAAAPATPADPRWRWPR
jgi:hypothetical protein